MFRLDPIHNHVNILKDVNCYTIELFSIDGSSILKVSCLCKSNVM